MSVEKLSSINIQAFGTWHVNGKGQYISQTFCVNNTDLDNPDLVFAPTIKRT